MTKKEREACTLWVGPYNPSDPSLLEEMRNPSYYDMRLGVIVKPLGTIDIECEVAEPKRLEPHDPMPDVLDNGRTINE